MPFRDKLLLKKNWFSQYLVCILLPYFHFLQENVTLNFNLFEKKEENQEKVACKLWSNFNAGR